MSHRWIVEWFLQSVSYWNIRGIKVDRVWSAETMLHPVVKVDVGCIVIVIAPVTVRKAFTASQPCNAIQVVSDCYRKEEAYDHYNESILG